MGCVYFLYFTLTLYTDVFCGALKRKNNIYFIYLKPIKDVYFCSDVGCISSPPYFIPVQVAQRVLK